MASAVLVSSCLEMIWSSHLNAFLSDLLSSPSFSISIDNAKVCTSPVWDVVATKYLCPGVTESSQDPLFPQRSSAIKTLKTRHLECGVFLERESACFHSAVQTRALDIDPGHEARLSPTSSEWPEQVAHCSEQVVSVCECLHGSTRTSSDELSLTCPTAPCYGNKVYVTFCFFFLWVFFSCDNRQDHSWWVLHTGLYAAEPLGLVRWPHLHTPHS